MESAIALKKKYTIFRKNRSTITESEFLEMENLHEIGLEYLNRKQFGDALKNFERILEINPDDADALLHKGEILAKTGKRDLALRTFEKITEFNPANIDALMHLAYILGTGRNPIEAIQYYDEVLYWEPNNSEALLNKSRELIILGRNQEALEVLKEIKTVSQDLMGDAWFNEGEALFRLKKYTEALEVFERLLTFNPKDHEGWYMKGKCLSQVGRKSEAKKAFLVAKSISPNLKKAMLK